MTTYRKRRPQITRSVFARYLAVDKLPSHEPWDLVEYDIEVLDLIFAGILAKVLPVGVDDRPMNVNAPIQVMMMTLHNFLTREGVFGSKSKHLKPIHGY